MDLLKDKGCVVAGGAGPRGIGRATSRLFHEHGAAIVIADLDEAQSRSPAADIGPKRALGVACDVTDKLSCEKTIADTVKAFNGVDVLINTEDMKQDIRKGIPLNRIGDTLDVARAFCSWPRIFQAISPGR